MPSRSGRSSRSKSGSRSASARSRTSSRGTRGSARSAGSSRSRSTSRRSKTTSSRSRASARSTASSRSSGTRRSAAKTRVLTDHEEIRQWAEERGAHPARVRGTGGDGDVGIIRLDFPGYSGEESLEPISWDEWFRKFDESNLALLVQDTTAGGQKSNFNKLVTRETLEEVSPGRRSWARKSSSGSRGASSRRKAA